MRARLRRGRWGLGLAAWLLCAASAAAEPEPPPTLTEAISADQLAAREDFREASRLAQREDWASALARYSVSQLRYPHATTLYNVGYCHERLGDYAAAVRDTREALTFQQRFPGRGLNEERRAQATIALHQLESKVSRVEIVPQSADLALRVNGRPLELVVEAGKVTGFVAGDAASTSFSPLSGVVVLTLNPGEHVLEWRSAAGAASRRLALSAGSEERLLLPEPSDSPAVMAKATLSAAPPPAPTPAAPEDARARKSSAGPLRPYGIAALAGGGGAALVGLGAGWFALQSKRELDAHCSPDGACEPGQADRIDQFHTQAMVATIALTSAAVLAGTGITLLLLDSPKTERAALELHISSNVVLSGGF